MGPIISDRFRIRTDYFGLVIYILSFQSGSCSCSIKDQTISDISSQQQGKTIFTIADNVNLFSSSVFRGIFIKEKVKFCCVLSTISLEERLSKSGKGVQFAFCKNFAAVMEYCGWSLLTRDLKMVEIRYLENYRRTNTANQEYSCWHIIDQTNGQPII